MVYSRFHKGKTGRGVQGIQGETPKGAVCRRGVPFQQGVGCVEGCYVPSSEILEFYSRKCYIFVHTSEQSLTRSPSDPVKALHFAVPVKPTTFYPNVTTLRSGLCCRNSVCRLSSVCLSSVTLVHPTQGVEPFGKISSPPCTLVIL